MLFYFIYCTTYLEYVVDVFRIEEVGEDGAFHAEIGTEVGSGFYIRAVFVGNGLGREELGKEIR